MRHLSDVELVDCVDGALPPARIAHLDACDACRTRARLLRGHMDHVRRVAKEDVPEPSPLFWEHFSQRVHGAVQDAEAAPRLSPGWLRSPLVGWTAATAIVVLVVAATFWTLAPPSGAPEPAGPVAAGESPAPSADGTPPDFENDADWALVRVVADGLQWEDAHDAGLSARPGSAERVALEMSSAERQELARLIEDELKRTGA